MNFIAAENNLNDAFNPGLWSALGWSLETWMGILNGLDCPVLIFDSGDKLLMANQEARRILSLSGPLGRPMPPHLGPLVKNALEGLKPSSLITSDGVYRFTLKDLAPCGSPNLFMALGEKKMEREDFQSPEQEGDVIGQGALMAGNMSQKVKGPLAGIELYASILDRELSESGDSSLTELIDEIRGGVRELNEYLTSFESMTKSLSLELSRFDLAEVIDDVLGSMSEVFKAKGIGVVVDQKSIVVEADRALISQLFFNLFINAVEAIGQKGGRVIVDMRRAPNFMAEVTVTDTGPGIDLYKTKEVFNPFYTTKDQALGLGLPVSRRIAEAHLGKINAGSDVTLGARIAVVLPCLDQALNEEQDTNVQSGVN
jgi:signal transduction histidine kinase